jgi:hypothetical protein
MQEISTATGSLRPKRAIGIPKVDTMSLPPEINESFLKQADICTDLGSPFTACLCRELTEVLVASSTLGRRVSAWPGNPMDDALPLRAAGGFHALARSGLCPELTAVYPPNAATGQILRAALRTAMAGHEEFLTAWLDSPPLTNEVARSSVILGGCLHIAVTTRLPLEVLEIGASAGLNLGFDRYKYELGIARWGAPDASVRISTVWEGDPPPLNSPLQVVRRAGCDLSPLDAASARGRERLLSYIWPDQAKRLELTASALDFATRSEWRVERQDAAEWLASRLFTGAEGRTRVVFHTAVWSYLAPVTKQSIKSAMDAAGQEASPEAPLAWLSVEPDGVAGSAAIRLTIWPPGETLHLGRSDYHGRWTRWNQNATPARGAALC